MFKFLRNLFLLETRKHPRFEPPDSIKSRCAYTASGKRAEIPVLILNISEGGAMLSTGDTKIFPKTSLEIFFDLPKGEKAISVHGEVLRTYRIQHEGAYYCAVKFSEEDEATIKALLDY